MSTTPEPDAPPTGAEVRAMTAATDLLIARFVSREDFDRHRRNVRLALVGVFVAGGLLVAVVVAMVVAMFKLGDVVDSNSEVIDAVNECITPAPPAEAEADPHECYDEGERRIAGAILDVGESFDRSTDRIIERLDELENMP